MTSPQPHHYPNPGFLGHSSHSAIFNQVFTAGVPADENADADPLDVATPVSSDEAFKGHDVAQKAIQALGQLIQMDIPNICSLVNDWLNRKINLPLAEPFVPSSVEAVRALWELRGHKCGGSTQIADQWMSQTTQTLLKNSRNPIKIDSETTVSDYLAQILGDSLRLEIIGMFFTAASRAAIDTDVWPSLYSGLQERRQLVKTVTYISDCCLEACLSLDCLNDLQAILQYENLIVHSQIDGDQSKFKLRTIITWHTNTPQVIDSGERLGMLLLPSLPLVIMRP